MNIVIRPTQHDQHISGIHALCKAQGSCITALCRKNYGCSHFIVGRDHAGVGNFYGPYDARGIFSRLETIEIGISPIFLEAEYSCRRCGSMATIKTGPHKSEEHIVYSGTQIRLMPKVGQQPPKEFTRPEAADILIEAYRERK